MARDRSRYLPRHVVQKLGNDARDRCCICGHFLALDDIPHDLEGDLLDQHHIIYFSEGGENTEDNLLLVCPYCHRRIHRDSARYNVPKLKEAKNHWIRMRDLLPERTRYHSDRRVNHSEMRAVPFHVMALNLNYTIDVPGDVSIADLAAFVGPWVMHPLVAYARLAPFRQMFGQTQLARLRLARKSQPEFPINPSETLAMLALEPNDALVALVDVEWVAAVSREREEEEDGVDADVVARITLIWRERPRDLDLHLTPVHGAARHMAVFFGNRGALRRPPWAALNIDMQNGFGPEVITIMSPATGPFFVDVDNYSGDLPLSESQALVVIEVADKQIAFQCPTLGAGRCWRVCKLDIETGIIERIDEYIDRPRYL